MAFSAEAAAQVVSNIDAYHSLCYLQLMGSSVEMQICTLALIIEPPSCHGSSMNHCLRTCKQNITVDTLALWAAAFRGSHYDC